MSPPTTKQDEEQRYQASTSHPKPEKRENAKKKMNKERKLKTR